MRFSVAVLLLGLLLAARTYGAEVYDCFLFFNELELLEIRLNEMGPYVDHFVIVEASETFQGKEKPLYFAENTHRFEAFKDKIRHIVLTEHFKTEDPWEREHFQREQILRGLKGCRKGDIVLISDLDEIVRGSCIPKIVKKISSKKAEVVVCEQKMYFGFLDRYQSLWRGTVGTSYGKLKEIGVLLARKLRNGSTRKLKRAHVTRFEKIPDAGWHFTSMGGVNRWIVKLESYSHTKKTAMPNWREGEEFQRILSSTVQVPLDSSFPKYVTDNEEYLCQMGLLNRFLDVCQ
ncbi:MAG: hypothetical protein JSS61_00075 [Verrucomicrobia bacterium]|nr:hypothetical protein [Verrucomicrobiota bacterium]